jgi:hypothetical protein
MLRCGDYTALRFTTVSGVSRIDLRGTTWDVGIRTSLAGEAPHWCTSIPVVDNFSAAA